jgi:hypothetical protein
MAWTLDSAETEYRYIGSNGDVIARVRLIGIRGRWRWRSPLIEEGSRNPGCGTVDSYIAAINGAEDFLRRVGAIS